MRERGFTLIELIVVIVLVSIVAYLGVNLITPVMEGYVSTVTRTFLFDEAQYGIERMSKEIRNAIPYTVRILDNGSAIQFVKFVDVGYYKYEYLDNITCYNIGSLAVGDNVSIYNTKYDYFYSGSRVYSITQIKPYKSGYDCILNKPVYFNSPYNRIYLVGRPVTFYFYNHRIYRNSGYSLADNSTGLYGGYMMIGYVDNVSFEYQPGTTYRQSIVRINLEMKKSGVVLDYKYKVHIRNVP